VVYLVDLHKAVPAFNKGTSVRYIFLLFDFFLFFPIQLANLMSGQPSKSNSGGGGGGRRGGIDRGNTPNRDRRNRDDDDDDDDDPMGDMLDMEAALVQRVRSELSLSAFQPFFYLCCLI